MLASSRVDSGYKIVEKSLKTTTLIVLLFGAAVAFLSARDRQPELMDQHGLDAKSHSHALKGLRAANALSRVSQAIWRGLREELAAPDWPRSVKILDIAAGGGDVVIGLAKLGRRHGVEMEVHGCDISPTAVDYAQRAAADAGLNCATFSCLNALVDALPRDYDVVMSTLFLHHLSECDASQLLRRMAQATRRCILISDLRRSRMGYCYAWAGARLLTRSPIVHTDGPLSVRAAFTTEEMRRIAAGAGLHGARFTNHWPERYLMRWTKAST